VSLISANLNGSASVALKLLTDAATRSANSAPLSNTLEKATRTIGVVAIPSTYSNGVRITLSLEAAEKAYGSNSFLMQTARGRADQVEISQTVIPPDKAGFKSDVLAFLSDNMKKDAGFMAALRSGQVTIQTVDELPPELNIQPYVSFEMYKDGNHLGGGSFGPDGMNLGLYEELGKTRGQAFGSLGNSQFLAHWPKSV